MPMPPSAAGKPWTPSAVPEAAVARVTAARIGLPGWFRRTDIHWAKKLMLVATLLWPLASGGCGLVSAVGEWAQYKPSPPHWAVDYSGMPVKTEDEPPLYALAFWFAFICVSFWYLLSMFVLLVLWFVTKQ